MAHRIGTLRASVLVLGLALADCVSAVPTAGGPSVAPGEALLSIESGTQAVIGELRIGAGNFREEAYSTADGQSLTGPTAGLWFSTSEAPADPPMVRVHTGQVVEVRGVLIRVIDVGQDVVHLGVQPVPVASPGA